MISGSYSLYNQDLWVSPGLVKLVVIVKTTGGASSTFNAAGATEQLNGASGIGTSQWLSNGNSIYYSLGNVGIGTTSPTNTLEVAGNTFLGGNLTATGTLSVTGNTTLAAATTTSLAITGITSQWLSTNANGSVIGNATPVTSLGGLTGSIATSSLGLQNKIALTTSGSSGASTFDGTTLNVPQYSSTVIPNTDNFRISAQSNVAVPTSDQIGAGSVYLVPYQGNMISLYTSSTWTSYATSTQGQFVLTGLTSGKNYDVFAYGSGTSVLLELSAAWASDSARTDALATQDGILVKSSDHSRRYLGTIRTTGTNTTEDSGGGVSSSVGGKRFVFNEYNQVPRFANVIDTTSSWSYTTGTVRQANGAVGNKVELVLGDASSTIILSTVYGDAYLLLNLARAGMVGVGLDTTTSFSGNVQGGYNTAASGIYAPVTGAFRGYVGLGYHYLSWNEDGADGTCTFLGSNAGDGQQTGLQASFSN
jgi:hypothetical protein